MLLWLFITMISLWQVIVIIDLIVFFLHVS